MKDKEKELKYLLYLKSEQIRILKKEMHDLKIELDELNKEKMLKRKRGKK